MYGRFAVICCSLFISLISVCRAQEYQISEFEFNSKGKTKPKFLLQSIPPLKKDVIFETKEEFEQYLYSVNQNLENTRLLEELTYNYEITDTRDGLSFVKVKYSFSDSSSFIIFPKPSYNSNQGYNIELAVKDTNFLGLCSSLGTGLSIQFGDKDEPDRYSKKTIGFNLDYDFPFYIGKTRNRWENFIDLNWCTEKTVPNCHYSTGLSMGIPFGSILQHEFELSLRQSIIRDTDFSELGDEFYFVEYAEAGIPVEIAEIDFSTPVYYRPMTSIEMNWDKDGINQENSDLKQTPLLKPGHKIYFEQIDWLSDNNFRTGYSFSLGNYVGIDFHEKNLTKKMVPSIECNISLYKGFNYSGINLNMKALVGYNTKYKAGSYIRGALDNAQFSSPIKIDNRNYAFTTQSAFIINLEFPIHIITTDWVSFFGKTGEKFERLLSYANFELQIIPFIDAGLIDNRGTGNKFNIKEGIYTSGLELHLYPLKWKSFVIRASLGFDLSKKLLNGKYGFDSSWRQGKNTECFVGLGLFF